MSPTQHLDAADAAFHRIRTAEELNGIVHGPDPSIARYPLAELARAVWHVAAANVLLVLRGAR